MDWMGYIGLLAAVIAVFWAYAVGKRNGYRAGHQARVGDEVMDAMKKSSQDCMASSRALTKDFLRKAYDGGLSILSVPIQQRGSRSAIGDQADFMSWQEGEPNALVRRAVPEDVEALRIDHYKLHVLGLKGIIGSCEERTILWKLKNAFYCEDPFQSMQPIRPGIGYVLSDYDENKDPFLKFMIGIMGVELNGAITRRQVDDLFNGAPLPHRLKWADMAIDAIYEWKVNPPKISGNGDFIKVS